MGVGSGDRGDLGPPWILKLLAKKVVFSISRGKNQISPLLDRPWKTFLENPLLPPGKNPSGTHEPSAPKLKMAKKRNKSHIIFATLLMCLQSLEKKCYSWQANSSRHFKCEYTNFSNASKSYCRKLDVKFLLAFVIGFLIKNTIKIDKKLKIAPDVRHLSNPVFQLQGFTLL